MTQTRNVPTYDFTNHVALVTGGASGIGAEITRAFAAAGARVAVVDLVDPATARAEFSQVRDGNERIRILRADVSNFTAAAETAQSVIDAWGGVHYLVNNAGVNRDKAIWNLTEEDWDKVIDVDLKGCFNYARALAPHFREQGRGRIVNISSINGLRGKFGQTNYAAAKAGVIGLSKSLARELGKYGVTVNAVAPGFIETPMTRSMDPEWRQAAVQETVLRRAGLPEDIAAVALFLCSDAARHITGDVIKVDGGQYI